MQIAVYEEADDLFAHLVVTVARRRGHTAKQVADLDQLRALFPSDPGAIVLGVSRVTDDVIARIEQLHAAYHNSVIFVAAEEASPGVTINALETGATDILHKPVLPRELLIRCERAHPARGGAQPEGAMRVADLEVDIGQVRAVKAGQELTLTRMELRLLYCLMQHHGRVTPTDRLVSFGWDSEELATSSLKTHISHLRQKLREVGGVPLRITARQMLGYVLETADQAQRSGAPLDEGDEAMESDAASPSVGPSTRAAG